MKMKKVLAAVFALAVVGANLGLAAFAEEAAVVTEEAAVVSEELVSTEPVIVEETAEEITEVTAEAVEEAAEEETQTEETTEINKEELDIESSAEDTSIIEGPLALPVITEGKTFTIGDVTFTAEVATADSYPWVLKIYNDNGLVFSKDVYNFPPAVSSIRLVVNGNTLIIKEYDASNRELYENVVEYNTNTGTFGKETNADSDNWGFEFAGKSFVAVKTSETKERYNEYGTEYDVYDYLSIYFADGTATRIQNKLVWVEYGRTGGFGGYGTLVHIEIEDDKLTIRQIINPDDVSKDILTTYIFDEEKNDFVEVSTADNSQNDGNAGSSGTVANSPATSDSMSIPAVAASAAIVLGAVICVSKKRK